MTPVPLHGQTGPHPADPPSRVPAGNEVEPPRDANTNVEAANAGVAVPSAPIDPQSRELGLTAALLMGVTLAIIVIFGLLLAWYVARRGRLLRERIPPPRVIEPLCDPNADLDQPTADGPIIRS